MNLLILSPGRRVEVVNYFKEEFHKIGGKIYTLDINEYSPALYFGDEYFIVKKDFNNLNKYIDDIISICKTEDIGYVISLIDPELPLLSANKEKFLINKIVPIVSDEKIINDTFDKYKFYKEYNHRLNLVKTYLGYKEIKKALEREEINFPLFAKMRNGSGSIGTGKINNMMELEYYKEKQSYIFQPYIKKKEYGVDVYFDMICGKISSIFIKEKIGMRSGETDKSISLFRKDILEEIMKLEGITGFKGPIDVDIFEDSKGELYVNEINPRFGGGYPHAYNCSVNFMKFLLENLNGRINDSSIGTYKKNVVMMKYNGLYFKDFQGN